MGNYFLAVVISCLITVRAFAQESPPDIASPSLHAGDWLTLKLRSKIQFDFGQFRPEVEDQTKILQGRRLRFGADGTLLRDLDFTFLVETGKGEAEVRDAFLKYRRLRTFQVQAGQFKIPMGLDQLTDSGELDFVERSRIGKILAPGRDTGAMILGDALERRLHYAAGVFQHDGRNSQIRDFAAVDKRLPGGSRTIAARLTIAAAPAQLPGATFRNLRFGVAFAGNHVPAGLSSLPGLTVSNQVFFPRMYVNGFRRRWEADMRWRLRSLSIQGELMDVRDQRLRQGLHGEDLPALRTQGWYVSAVHPLLGHLKTVNGRSLSSILPGMHLGLFEATARYEVIRFSSESSAGSSLPSPSPRAANVVGNDERLWTFGINWRANTYVKFQFNGIREMLRDPDRTPVDGENRYWTMIGRAQIYF